MSRLARVLPYVQLLLHKAAGFPLPDGMIGLESGDPTFAALLADLDAASDVEATLEAAAVAGIYFREHPTAANAPAQPADAQPPAQ